MIIVSWIFVGFLSWLFLLLSTLRKSEYNKEDLKDYFNVRDLLCICLCGWFSPVIIFVIILLCYIADKFESRKLHFREGLYDILYKIANIGVNKKEEDGSDRDEII